MRVRPLLAGAAALALALAACGGDGDGDDDAGTTTAPVAASASTTEPDPQTTTAEQAELSELLVTTEDVGDGFVAEPYAISRDPGPCGFDVDTDHVYRTIAGTELVDEDSQLFLRQELRLYAEENIAVDAFAFAREGLSCGAGTDVTGLVLGQVTDVTADVGADGVLVPFTVEELGFEGGYAVVRVGPALSSYYVQSRSEGEEALDLVEIVAANVETLRAELG